MPDNVRGPHSTVENEAYGMIGGFENPYYSNRSRGPELPPRQDLYSIPQNIAPESDLKRSDSYIKMNPATTLERTSKMADEYYAEIPPVNGTDNIYERVGEEHWPQEAVNHDYSNVLKKDLEGSGASNYYGNI